ncbi:MAG: 1,4-beta-xylanase [Clostridiales bacterium]|nr:1,4-beta-xylanase [Clostridiales bacterium]
MTTKLDHRRGTARLALTYPDGSPMKNRPVRIRLRRHRFLFGAGMFDVLALVDPATGEAECQQLQTRMEALTSLFNYATLPFYWGRYEAEEGQPDSARTRAGAAWLKERGLILKGHPLCWHTVCAPWLLQYDTPAILDRQLARIDREVGGFAGLIDSWDVINEVVIMPDFDRYDNAVTRLARAHGRVGLVKMVFERARQANPKAQLLLNDFNTSPRYEQLIADCLDAGVPIDAIGIQSHQHQGYWGADRVAEVLARFARFGLPIHFTENTLVSGDLMPPHIVDLNDWQPESWPTTPEGEERQARQLTEMYRLLFAHPQVQAITNWDAVDGKWLGAPSGLLRQDNSKKPAYEALAGLIRQEWHTGLRLVTDEAGALSFTGFLGDYDLVHDQGELTFTLDTRQQDIRLSL